MSTTPTAVHHPAGVRPADDECAEYYHRYIARALDGDLRQLLRSQRNAMTHAFMALTDAQSVHRPRPDAWNAREILGHLIDTERVFSARATHFSRGDAAPLPSFDQDAWLPFGSYGERSIESLLDEWSAVRGATTALVDHMPADGWSRRGIASEVAFTTRAALWIIPGHVQYHLDRLHVTTQSTA
jgi:hypothetical protein